VAKRTRYPYEPSLTANTDEVRGDNAEREERERSERSARGGRDVTTPSPEEEPTFGEGGEESDPEYSKTSSDDSRDDSDDEARADQQSDSEGGPTRTTEADGPAFIVEDEGTIINGIYYPDSQAKVGMEKVVYMPEAEAQELVKNGMRLTNRETMEPVEAPEELPPEPEVDDPDADSEEDLPEGSMRGEFEDNVRRAEREKGAPNPDVDPTVGEQTRLSAVRDPNRRGVQVDMTQPRTSPNPAQPRDKGPDQNKPRDEVRTR
jgi:hypothetical protein